MRAYLLDEFTGTANPELLWETPVRDMAGSPELGRCSPRRTSYPIGGMGLPRPLLKFSGGLVTFYATFFTDAAMPSC